VEKVLEKLGTTESTTLNVRREECGKIRVGSLLWETPKFVTMEAAQESTAIAAIAVGVSWRSHCPWRRPSRTTRAPSRSPALHPNHLRRALRRCSWRSRRPCRRPSRTIRAFWRSCDQNTQFALSGEEWVYNCRVKLEPSWQAVFFSRSLPSS
jgi:hypothetical protein